MHRKEEEVAAMSHDRKVRRRIHVPERPSYCAAASPEECDHPFGCTACCSAQEKVVAALLTQETVSGEVLAELALRAGLPEGKALEEIGSVDQFLVVDGVLHAQVRLTPKGRALLEEMERAKRGHD